MAAALIREGHWHCVETLGGDQFAAVVEVFDSRPEIGGTYFRPTERGLQPVDLSLSSPKPMLGIGDVLAAGVTVGGIESEIDDRVASLLAKRKSAKRSREKSLEAKWVKDALRLNLNLDRVELGLRFICSQWRLELGDRRAQLLDLLAVNVDTAELVVVELKPDPDARARAQVLRYVDFFRAHAADLEPFFSELANAMSSVYGCNDMPTSVVAGSTRGLTVWPGPGGRGLEVKQCQ